jgi:DnaK suppressor protein
MARREALLRLANTLQARRTALRKKLSDELANMRDYRTSESAGDTADTAFEADSDEMSSRLVELEDRELRQIDRALECLKSGGYGHCDGGSEKCQKMIPVARLNVLPHTTLCIHCERAMERYPNGRERWRANSWGRVADSEPSRERRPIAELESDSSVDR